MRVRALTALSRMGLLVLASTPLGLDGLMAPCCCSTSIRAPLRSPHRGAYKSLAASAPPPVVPDHSIKIRGEVITPFGLLLGASVFGTACLVQIPVFLCYLWSLLFDQKRRRGVDWIIHFWAWAVSD